MRNSELDSQPTNHTGASRHTCPLCSASLVRMPRRAIDHLLSRFVPLQRYRCERFACQWQGNIRADAALASNPGTVTPTES